MNWEIREGDCLEVLRGLEPSSVQTCVTSPPYWGLRDYGTATWEGGDSECDHLRQSAKSRESSTIVGSTDTQGGSVAWLDGKCGRCGAKRIDSQLGLEPTPEQYVENLVNVFREARRVLRDDGTLWLNLGDSYAGSWGNQGRKPGRGTQRPINGGMLTPVHDDRHGDPNASNTGQTPPGLKPKDLVGIPWRVAFALQADGWWLRSDIIWSKPNPMPESVTDRPTRAHEYIFLLAKSARYFYDADAIREKGKDWSSGGPGTGIEPTFHYGAENGGNEGLAGIAARYKNGEQAAGRNKRSVWEITTQPYPEAHFATFPPKLVEPCILAGSPPKCCGECGAPWERIVERTDLGMRERTRNVGGRSDGLTRGSGPGEGFYAEHKTVGWRPTCECLPIGRDHVEATQSTVLDPFCGAGTTGLVATQHGRDFIGIELNPEYAEMARERIRRYEANPAGALEGDPEPIEGQIGLL